MIRWKRLWQNSWLYHLSRIWKTSQLMLRKQVTLKRQVVLRKKEMAGRRQVKRKEAVSFFSISLLLIVIDQVESEDILEAVTADEER